MHGPALLRAVVFVGETTFWCRLVGAGFNPFNGYTGPRLLNVSER
jgi:hypothetical protein